MLYTNTESGWVQVISLFNKLVRYLYFDCHVRHLPNKQVFASHCKFFEPTNCSKSLNAYIFLHPYIQNSVFGSHVVIM